MNSYDADRLEKYKKRIELLREFYLDHKRMPTYTEMMRLFAFKSKNAVAQVVRNLIKDNIVKKDSTGLLSPVKLNSLPLLGLVEAGFPTPAEEDTMDNITLDEYMIKDYDASYILRVKGDSMIDAGIHEGDLVVVERTNEFKPGDIVVANIDGDWTMKYYRIGGPRGPYLQAGNPNYPDLHPSISMKIEAVVRGVVRKYT